MRRVGEYQRFSLLWLTTVWVLLWGQLSVANVVSGVILGAVVLTVFPLPRVTVGVRLRPVRFLRLLGRFLLDVIVASLHVAWLTVRPGPVPRSSVVTIQLRSRNELFETIVAEMQTLVPGSLAVDLDARNGRLSMHALEVATPEQAEAFRRAVLDQEARVLAALASRDTAAHGPGPGRLL